MASGMDERKRILRARVREERRHRPPEDREAAASGIAARLDALVEAHGARTVSCFLSTPAEPGTRGFVTAAAARGIRLLLPITRVDGLLDWAAADGSAIGAGLFGIPEPTGVVHGAEALDEVDLMIVPAAAVDRSGTRLGWGRGYFDRALSGMAVRPPVYAVIYDSEVLDSLPREPHDQPVDGIVTPTRTIALAPH